MNRKIALGGIAIILAGLALGHLLRTSGNSGDSGDNDAPAAATVAPDASDSSGRDNFDAVFNEERRAALQQPGEKRQLVVVEPNPLPPEQRGERQVRRSLPENFKPEPVPAPQGQSGMPGFEKAGAGTAMPEDGPGGRPAGDAVVGPGAGPGDQAVFDPSTGPGYDDIDVQSLGPGANEYDSQAIDKLGIDPGPGPGESLQEPPGRGPGADDPRTPPPTVPDRSD